MTKVNYAEKFDNPQIEEPVETTENIEVEKERLVTATVECDLLNLRDRPNGEIISKLSKGTVLHVDYITLRDEVWVSVTTASGLSGYVMRQYIKY